MVKVSAEKNTARSRTQLRRAYGLVCLIAVLGVAISIILHAFTMSRTIAAMERDFQHDVSVQSLSLRHKTQVLQQMWEDMQAFYLSSHDVEKTEFESFASTALNHDSIVFVSWVPADAVLPAQDDIYMLSRHIEDYKRFKAMIMTDESIHDLVRNTGDSTNARASIVNVSIDGNAEYNRVVIAVPTFVKPASAPGHSVPTGYLLTLLDTDALFESVFVGDLYGSVAVYLLDSNNETDLLFYQLYDPSFLSYFTDNYSKIDIDMEAVRTIPFAGETLAIVAQPAFGYGDVGGGPWLVLLMGLMITAFIVYRFYQQVGQTAEIQRIVDQKTKALADSEQRVRSIIDHALDAIVTFDDNNRILEWNKQAETIFGWSAGEAIGRDVRDLAIAPQYKRIHDRGMKRFLKTGQSKILNKRVETRGIRRDGSIFPMESAVTEQKIGETYYFTAFIRDITERRDAERTKERLAAIVMTTDDAIISIDLKGIIQSWNKGAEQLYGYKGKDVEGKSIHIIVPEDRRFEEDEILKTIARGDTIDHIETVRQDKAGNRLMVSATISPLKDQYGHVIGASKVARDITERKKVEARLKEYTESLKQSNAELDDFVYIVSHDLKEPIRGLYSYAQFLQEDYGDALGEDGNQKLDTLKKLATRMEELIDTLLYYSRLGRTELAYKPTDLNITVNKVLDLVETFAKEQNATIVVQEKLPTILCDRARVGEVFRNLIVNAIKYNDSDDKYVEVGCTTDHKDYMGLNVFYVSDNGIGIPEKHQDVVFKMFKRLHSRDRYGGGTGSGLALVKKMVDRHGGKIWIESGKGQGTTFYFTLEEFG